MKDNFVLYLVRHGETVFNVEKIIQGHSNSELTENGISQANYLKSLLKDITFDEFYSSDLDRAVKTAEIIVNGTGLQLKTDKNLRERCYGRFEGKHVSELKVLDEKINLMDNKSKFKIKIFSDVESDNEVALRIVDFINCLRLKKCSKKTILAVTHAGTIRSLLLYLGWGDYDNLPHGAIKNTSYIKLLINENNIEIVETFEVNRLF